MSETQIDADQPVADEPETPVADAPQEEVETATETEPDLAAEVEKWKALSKKNERRAKENAEKATKFDEIEEANKTEQQKLLDRAEKAETALKQAERKALRASKSAESGIPVELIHGETEEEMDTAVAAAKQWAESRTKPSPAAPANLVTSNGESTKVKPITSRDEFKSMTHEQRLAAINEGRLDELMGKTT